MLLCLFNLPKLGSISCLDRSTYYSDCTYSFSKGSNLSIPEVSDYVFRSLCLCLTLNLCDFECLCIQRSSHCGPKWGTEVGCRLLKQFKNTTEVAVGLKLFLCVCCSAAFNSEEGLIHIIEQLVIFVPINILYRTYIAMQMFKCRWGSESEVKTSFKKAELKKQKNGIYNPMEFHYSLSLLISKMYVYI